MLAIDGKFIHVIFGELTKEASSKVKSPHVHVASSLQRVLSVVLIATTCMRLSVRVVVREGMWRLMCVICLQLPLCLIHHIIHTRSPVQLQH